MQPPAIMSALLDGRDVRPAGEHVWSVLPGNTPGQRYDRRAAAYDRVVGSRMYNRLLWGSSPSTYAAFAEHAVRSNGGPLLDAGCGSLVFTGDVYIRADRPLVLVDQSLGMLYAARDRLMRAIGGVPEHIVLLQADIRDLPVRKNAFSTVLCMGMFHLFDDISGILAALARVLHPGGQMFATSLVARTWLGARYLGLLHRAREVARPRTIDQLRQELRTTSMDLSDPDAIHIDGSMAFITARRAAETVVR